MIPVVGEVRYRRTIAVGRAIRELGRLVRTCGPGRWRKCSGLAWIELPDGSIHRAELRWYEAHGIGRKEYMVKRLLRG